MMTRLLIIAVLMTGAVGGPAFAAKVTPDLISAPRRQATVDTAIRLAGRASLPNLPEDMLNPFNPAGFDQAEGDSTATTPTQRAGTGAPTVAAPPTDRDILEALALHLNPSGVMVVDRKPLLLIDRNRLEVGTKFVVTDEGREYELQLISIDRTTFTLRYRGEEFIRPIKPLK